MEWNVGPCSCGAFTIAQLKSRKQQILATHGQNR